MNLILYFKRTTDVGAFWNIIRQEVNRIPENAYDKSKTEEQNNHTTKNKNRVVNASSTPTMVFSVIGDSDSFVPRPWPKTVFQTALIEAAKSGGGMFSFNTRLLMYS